MLGELFSTAVEGDGQVADALEIFPRAGELSRLFGLLAKKTRLKHLEFKQRGRIFEHN